MSTSIQSTLVVSFDAETNSSQPVQLTYRLDRDAVELKQGGDVIWVPFEDAADFVEILRKWVEENTAPPSNANAQTGDTK